MVSTTAFLALAGLLVSSANAHMIMKSPVPFSKDKIDSGPITAAQFPCKSQLGFTVSQMNKMKVGEKNQISFSGSAVHGGGSCQLSITTDKEPTANSVFKVIKSIEGGCPGVGPGGGNASPGTDGGNVYDFELPDSIPNGQVTFAWTWMPKLSGAPEFYMNCAPVEVSGGASDNSKFNELPDMFVSNINECKTPVGGAVKFPNPGSVLQDGGTGDVAPPTGACAAGNGGGNNNGNNNGGSNNGNNGNNGGGNNSKPAASASAPPANAPAPTKPAQATAAPAPSAPSNPGGVFAPGASSAAPPAATSTATTLMTVTAPASGPTAPAGNNNPPAAPAPTKAPSNGGGSGTGNSCAQDGAIMCNGANQFGLCNHGQVIWQNLAEGTTCTAGKIVRRDFLQGLSGRVKPRLVEVEV